MLWVKDTKKGQISFAKKTETRKFVVSGDAENLIFT
jgi:hypothetical protein